MKKIKGLPMIKHEMFKYIFLSKKCCIIGIHKYKKKVLISEAFQTSNFSIFKLIRLISLGNNISSKMSCISFFFFPLKNR